jgi:hypothetical protein
MKCFRVVLQMFDSEWFDDRGIGCPMTDWLVKEQFQNTSPCRYAEYQLTDTRNIIGTLFDAEIHRGHIQEGIYSLHICRV